MPGESPQSAPHHRWKDAPAGSGVRCIVESAFRQRGTDEHGAERTGNPGGRAARGHARNGQRGQAVEGAPGRRGVVPGRRRRAGGRTAGVCRLLLGQRALPHDLPEHGPLRARGDRDDGRPAPRRGRGRRHLFRRHGEQPARRQVCPRPGEGAQTRGDRAGDRRPGVCPSVLRQGGRLLRTDPHFDAADARWTRGRPGLPRGRHRQHRADGRVGPEHRPRHGRPHPRDGGRGRGAGHQLPRRRLRRRLFPSVHGEARLRGHTLGLPRAGGYDDLGRPAQVRLHGQGRLGDPVPRRGHLPVPGLRLRASGASAGLLRHAHGGWQPRGRAPSRRRGP